MAAISPGLLEVEPRRSTSSPAVRHLDPGPNASPSRSKRFSNDLPTSPFLSRSEEAETHEPETSMPLAKVEPIAALSATTDETTRVNDASRLVGALRKPDFQEIVRCIPLPTSWPPAIAPGL